LARDQSYVQSFAQRYRVNQPGLRKVAAADVLKEEHLVIVERRHHVMIEADLPGRKAGMKFLLVR
jgi:hypothetical protein